MKRGPITLGRSQLTLLYKFPNTDLFGGLGTRELVMLMNARKRSSETMWGKNKSSHVTVVVIYLQCGMTKSHPNANGEGCPRARNGCSMRLVAFCEGDKRCDTRGVP